MRPLRYSINLSLDGYCGHEAIPVDEHLHAHATRMIGRADALVLGRTTYQMMEAGWREPADRPEWMQPFADTIGPMRKHVVSSTLDHVDWNAELLRGDLAAAVQALKDQPGEGLYTGGVQLPMALTELGLIDEYTFLVHPCVVGHGPSLFAGLSRRVDLELVDREELPSGALGLTYRPRG